MKKPHEQAHSEAGISIEEQIEKIILKEKTHIRPEDPDRQVSGLALSGGGIRSASFGLGVMQALYAGYDEPSKELLRKFDYLSTVSGGGYIGTSMTWFSHQDIQDRKKEKDEKKYEQRVRYALGRKGVGARTEANTFNQRLNFIRQHGNYLVPEKKLDLASLFSMVLRTIFVSLAVYLAMAVVMLKLFDFLNFFEETIVRNILGFSLDKPFTTNFLFICFIGMALGIACASLLYSLLTWVNIKDPTMKYKFFVSVQKIFGFCTKVALLLVLVGSLPYAHDALSEVWQKIMSAGLLTIGSGIGLLQSKREYSSTKKAGGLLSDNLMAATGAFCLVYGILYAAYMLAGRIENITEYLYLIAATFFFAIIVNVNYSGLHRMYRDRLMETFMPDKKNVTDNKWGLAQEANKTLISDVKDVSGKDNNWPYQLINTNIVLVDSDDSRYRGRGGDSFMLSPLYCGSYATGYVQTEDFEKTRMTRKGMTLPSAMAISGAAANPNTGVAGKGVTRNKFVSMLMSLLNLRLGYWVLNPRKIGKIIRDPNYLFPGLTKGVFGHGLDENSYFIELSDGGHFENLGLYELIRRKTQLIIVSDGGADPNYTFDDLANAVERVRVDFGVKIRFRDCSKCSLRGVMPGSAGTDYFKDRYKIARRGFAIADVNYVRKDPTKDGVLIYIKPTMIEGLPEDIYSYKSAHETFPDQPTTDQFFDEAQFEAYRELGYQLSKEMLQDVEVQRVLKGFFKL